MPLPTITLPQILNLVQTFWSGGPSAVLTYSVPGTGAVWTNYPVDGEQSLPDYNFLSTTQADVFRATIELIDSYILATFNPTDDLVDPGTIRIAFTTEPVSWGFAYYPSGSPNTDGRAGDIWLSTTHVGLDGTFEAGSYNLMALTHEIGHALGLRHSFAGPSPLPVEYDTTRYTVMSYTEQTDQWVRTFYTPEGGGIGADSHGAYSATMMVFDIYALQTNYGADPTTFAGNTVHTFNPANDFLQTIYDASGIDTWDLTGHTRPSYVDLRPGAYSSIDYYSISAQIEAAVAIYGEWARSYITSWVNQASTYTWTDNVGIAYSTTIENVQLGNGDDTALGNDVANVLSGNAGADALNGGAGNDTLDGGTGVDAMTGGLGDDTFIVDNTSDTVSELSGEGNDIVQASASFTLSANVERLTLTGVGAINGTGNALANTINGNTAANTLIGNGGDDILNGNDGNDSLQGNDGADTLNGGAGADSMVGNAGDDTYYVDNVGDTVSEGNISGGVDTVYSTVTFNLASTAYADNLILQEAGGAINGSGNSLDNTITGNGSANTLQGSVGNDTLWGGVGNDTLYGGDGNDTMYGEAGADTMTGNLGDDFYDVDNAGDVVLEGNIAGGVDSVYSSVTFSLGSTGYADNLTLSGSANIDGFGNILNNVLNGNEGANALWGNGGNDNLAGGAGNDTLYGGDGMDTLNGNEGADAMIGNFGDDSYYVDNVGDTVSEGNIAGGTDIVIASVNFQLGPTGYADNLLFVGTANLTGVGNGLNNIISGNSGNNSLSGNAGDDTLYGYDGGDTLVGGDGNDTLDGGIGADAMVGNAGNDSYFVDNAGDTVSEGSNTGGTDIVYSSVTFNLGPAGFVENLWLQGSGAINAIGNNLANTLTGNSAANSLTGNGGADTFVFNAPLGPSNIDTITDFVVVDDTIFLSQSIFLTLSAGTLAASAFVIGAAAADASDRIIYNSATGALYYDADGNGAGAAVQFAQLTAGLALTNNDFIVGGG